MAEETIHVVGAAVLRAGRCLVTRRGPGQDQAGRWEFPGGKVEPEESPEGALRRELAEELGIRVEVLSRLGRGEAVVDGRRILLDVYEARWLVGEVVPREHDRWIWLERQKLSELDWAPADMPVVATVVRRMESST